MKKQPVDIQQLKIGMFVELPGSWISHDFFKSKFLITSNEQLQKIQSLKLQQVVVDFARSKLAPDKPYASSSENQSEIQAAETVIDPRLLKAPENWDPTKLMTDELRNILDNHNLTAEQKSTFIYYHSIDMMRDLLQSPTTDNINLCKDTVYHITETLLSENDTAMNLLRISSHDYSTYSHSVDVGILSILLSKLLYQHSDRHNLNELGASFFLHDLGKVGIDFNILNKPGKLTTAEMQLVHSHPAKGYEMLKEASALTEECKIIVMQHHENIDGSGYPNNLKGDDIHQYGKICAIVDVYTALTAERSYKQALTTFQALKFMKDSMMHRFDRELFKSFVTIF